MFNIIIVVATSIFVVLLFMNLYFRIKLLKTYRRLVEGQVEFPPSMIFKTKQLEQEIVPKYPKYKDEILSFSRHLNFSVRIAFVVFLIALFIGYQYIKYR